MSKPWLAQYPVGVPAEISSNEFASSCEMFDVSCRRFADLPALTFRQLDRASRNFASWLQNVAGLRLGDRVTLMMPNLLQYPVALFGVPRVVEFRHEPLPKTNIGKILRRELRGAPTKTVVPAAVS